MDRRELDALDLADQAVGIAVEIIGFEHAADDGRGARVLRLQRLDQLEVLRVEDPAHDRQGFRCGHAQAVDRLLDDAGRRQFFVELRTGTMDDDGRQAHVLQEGQRRSQCGEIVAQHRAADLHHGKTRGIELREALEVLRDLLGAGHARQQADDGLPGLGIVDFLVKQRRHVEAVPSRMRTMDAV